MAKLRKIEQQILRELEKDSRISLSKLGKSLKKSQQQISYTVSSLVKRGIIQSFFPIIDYSKLDVINFRAYFKVTYSEEEKFEELIDYLVSHPMTSWIESVGGRYDLIVTFLTSNPSQFNKHLKAIMEKFPKQIQNYNVLTTIVVRRFGRKYLYNEVTDATEIIFGGDRKPEQIDNVDLKILENLSGDARISSLQIANGLDITSKTVIERIKKLQNNEIVMGYKPLLDMTSIGMISRVLLIKYHNISVDLENKLIKYLKLQPNIISAVKTLGQWDLEIYIETTDPLEFRKIEIDIRQKFTKLIMEIESVPLYKTYKHNYFPSFLI